MSKSTVWLPIVYLMSFGGSRRTQSHHVREDVPFEIDSVEAAPLRVSVSWKDGRSCDWHEVDGRLYRPMLGSDGKPIATAEDLRRVAAADREHRDYPFFATSGRYMRHRSYPSGLPTREEALAGFGRLQTDGRQAALDRCLRIAQDLRLVGGVPMLRCDAPEWHVGDMNRPAWGSQVVELRIPGQVDEIEGPVARFAADRVDDAEIVARRIVGAFPDDTYGRVEVREAEIVHHDGYRPAPVGIPAAVEAWGAIRGALGGLSLEEVPFDVLRLVVEGENAARAWREDGDDADLERSLEAMAALARHAIVAAPESTVRISAIREIGACQAIAAGFARELTEEDRDILSMGVM